MRGSVRALGPSAFVIGAIAFVILAIVLGIIAFQHGQAAQCGYYKGQGGPQWAIDKYCGPQK